MKLRPNRNNGISVSLSKKFYERSTFQTEQQLNKLQQQNFVKKQMIRRMSMELDRLKDSLEQESHKLNRYCSTLQETSSNVKIMKNLQRNTKSKKEFDAKMNKKGLESGQIKKSKRSQSFGVNIIRKTSNSNELNSGKKNAEDPLWNCHPVKKCKKSIKKVIHEQKVDIDQKTLNSSMNQGQNSKQNYNKYLEIKLKQMAKQTKNNKQAQIKIKSHQAVKLMPKNLFEMTDLTH